MEEQISSIVEALKINAEKTPDKLCVGDKKNQVTYKQFWNMVKKAAVYLQEKGVQKGDMVVIRGAQKVEFLLGVFSVQLAGGAVCPLEKAIKDDRIIEIMNFVDSNIYLAERPVKNTTVNNISLKEMFKVVQNNEAVTPNENTDNSENVVLNESSDSSEAVNSKEFSLPASDDLSEILFTTGTTGKSKGIEVTFGCNVAIAQNVIDSVGMEKDEIELITTPINHSLAIRRSYGAIYNGSSIVLTDGIKFVEDFFKLLDRYKITAITFVPAILEQVLKFAKDRFATYDNQFHYIQLGSAPLSETNKEILTKMFPTTRLYNTYGATESGCTVILEFSKYGHKKKCIGRTTVNTEILFVDDKRNIVEASLEKPGILAFKGKMNMRSYYKEPEITKEVMDEKGVVYTNDLGYLGEDGLVYLLGRQGDVINMGGIKIAPTEIEEVAMKHEMIKDCACIPIKDEITGEAPKLFVTLNEGYQLDQKELSKYLLSKLESLKVPKTFEVIDEIPRTFNGKIIRKQLKALENN
ncbi:class I adenylate-forming enzyme family protein [Eubacterium sp. Marseille-QA0814]|uniref:class I adenylate-forming enzyme family protein n=1 Tax=Eubacterium sp. Marseille-QA0814 TaxID=3378778 RepID=UPI003D0968EC